MFLLKAENISMETGGKQLFENANLEILEHERIALIGENGIGKSTFIKGLLGQAPIASGTVRYGISIDEIGYMPQNLQIPYEGTVRETVQSWHPNFQLKQQLQNATALLEKNNNDQKIIKNYNQALQKFLDADGYAWEVETEKILRQIGIPEQLWDTPFANLSGGQKTRCKLAGVILRSPKLIILDEPTNHLDMESIQWLEEWLKNFHGSILFVSHEREFIDTLASSIYELTEKGTKKYIGGFREYKEQKELEQRTKMNEYEKQRRERKKLLETIRQYKEWYSKAISTASVRNPYEQKKLSKMASKFKAKEKTLEHIEKEKPEKPEETKTIKTSLTSSDFSGRKMLELKSVSFAYDDKQPLFKNISLDVQPGDRIAIVGKNGSGKTTLLKILTGILQPTYGEVKWNPQLVIGQFFQELENLNMENTILDEILALPDMNQSDARTILACFLFRRDSVYKKISTLSMGEKCRVAFVKLYFSKANLLVLDEPTNYFDIPTRETIEDVLLHYPGALVIVAHDPYLLRKIVNKVVHLENGQVTVYPGSYKEWEQHLALSSDLQEKINNLKRLKLEYTALATEETENEDFHLEQQRLEKMKDLKQQIDDIEKYLKIKGIE